MDVSKASVLFVLTGMEVNGALTQRKGYNKA